MNIAAVEQGVKVIPFDGATPFYLKRPTATCELRHEWYLGCYFAEETRRGLSGPEDRLFAALFHARPAPGSSVTLRVTTQSAALLRQEIPRADRPNHQVHLFH